MAASTSRQLKDIETKMQEKLHENLFLIMQVSPPSEQFKAHFKKDMFVKSNKAGFYEVVYYLLNILNPELTKQKLTSWPPYDIRLESKFRSELIQYINEINTIYENADIPVLMTSHFITPNGIKILKFMLRLTELVMYEYLAKSPGTEHVIARPRSSNLEPYIRNLVTIIDKIEEKTRFILENWKLMENDCKKQAEQIIDKKTKLDLEIGYIVEDYEKVKEECQAVTYSVSEMEMQINALKNEVYSTEELKKQTDELDDKASSLYKGTNVVKVASSSDILDDMRNRLNPKDSNFNVMHFLCSLSKYLSKATLLIPNLPEKCLVEVNEKVCVLNEKYLSLEKRLEQIRGNLNLKLDEYGKELVVKLNLALDDIGCKSSPGVSSLPSEDSDSEDIEHKCTIHEWTGRPLPSVLFQ